MSDAVDTRIVEAKFDSSDFEKGVNKTVKKLDELKKALELKDTGKSITDLTKTANEGIEKAGNSLDKLSNRLTTFTGMVKNQLLGGLAQQVSNVFLQIEQGIMGFVHSISGGQVSAGLNKYTEILNAVRVMTASGVDQSAAYEAVKRLGEYSDQTSYSLSQMTSGMSKLVAAGAKLGDAEKMMEGLSNMAASAGVNIYDANRAFLNFSQAFSSGSMRIQDWMSLENLNMATKDVMDIFMQAGAEAGTLIKDKNGNYKTSNKKNKKVKGGKAVSNKGFRDTLSYGWLDQETMRIATGALSYFEDLGVSLSDLTSEQLEEFSTKAFQAAKEARSFADVMGTLRDVISTGWAQTFEYILGPLDKATKFFTWLSESNLAEIIYSIGEYRNEVLRIWSGIGSESLGRDSTTILVNSLKNLDAVLGSLHKSFQRLFPSEKSLAFRLREMTLDFNNFTKSIHLWFIEVDKKTGKSRSDKIAESFGFIGTAFSVAGRIISTAWNAIKSVFEALEPTFDAVTNVFTNFSASVDEMNKNTTVFDNISNAVQNILTIADPLLKVLPTILEIGGQIGTFFLGMAVDTFALNVQLIADALGFLLEVFGVRSAQMEKGTGVLEGIKNDIVAMGNAAKSAIGAIRIFFDALFGDLKTLLGINKETGELEEGGLFANVKNFFDTNEFVASAKAWIDQAVIDVGSFIQSIPSRLSQFAINIRDVIHGLFYKKEAKSGSAKTKGPNSTLSDFAEYTEVETELKKWLDQAILDVKTFFADLPKKVSSAVGSFGSLIGNFWHGLFYKKEYVNGKGGQQFKGEYIEIATPLKAWVDQAIKDVKQFIKDLPKNIQNGIKEVGSIVEAFWHGLFYERKENNQRRGGVQTRLDSLEIETPLKRWLDQTVRSVKTFIQNIPKYVQSAIKYTGSIIRALVNGLFGREDGEDVTADDILAQLRAPFKDLTLTKIIDDLKNIGKTLLNQVVSIFTGTDDVETNSEVFATALAEGITWIRTKAEGAWKVAKEFIENLPQTIANFFNGERTAEEIEANTKEQGPVEKALREFGESVGHFIEELPFTIGRFFSNARQEIEKLWSQLYNAITGTDANGYDDFRYVKQRQKTSAFTEFANQFGGTIVGIFEGLPQHITEGLNIAMTGIDSAIQWIGSWFAKKNTVTETMDEALAKEDGDAKEQSGLIIAINALCETIKRIITETVPGALTEAWTWVSTNATEWKEKVGTILNDNGITWENLQIQAENIGAKISEFINKIPDYITVAGDFFDRLWNGSAKDIKGPEDLPIFDFSSGKLQNKLDKDGKVLVTEVEHSGGLKQAILRIGESLKGAFSNIGPKILEGLNSALQWVQGGFEKVTTFLNERDKSKSLGESIAEAAGADTEDSGFFKAIQSLGETIKNVITQTIPGFISAAFTEVKDMIPGLLSTLFGGLFGGKEVENVEKEAVDEYGRIIDEGTHAYVGRIEETGDISKTAEKKALNIGEVFSSIWTSLFGIAGANAEGAAETAQENIMAVDQTLQTMQNLWNNKSAGGIDWGFVSKMAAITAVLAAVGVIINKIADIFSVADEIEAVTYGIGAAGLGVAFAAIGVMLAQLVALANQTTEDGKNAKLDSALTIFDKLTEFVKTIGEKLAIIVGLWKGIGFADTIVDAFASIKTASTGGFVKNAISGASAGLAGFGVGGILTGIIQALIGQTGTSLLDLGTQLGNFLDIISPIMTRMADLNDPLQQAVKVPGQIINLIHEFQRVAHEVVEYQGKEIGDTSHESLEYYTNSILKFMMGIGTFISNLSNGLMTFDSLKDPIGTLEKMANDKFLNQFSSFVGNMLKAIGKGALGSLSPSTYGADVIQDMSLQFELLGNALGVFGTGIANMTPESIDALDKTLKTLETLGEALSSDSSSTLKQIADGKASISTFGLELQQFSSYMKYFAQNIKAMDIDTLNEDEISQFKEKIDLSAYAVKAFAAAFLTAASSQTLGRAATTLDTLITGLPTLSSSIAGLIIALNNEIPDVDLERITVIEKVANVFEALATGVQTLDYGDINKKVNNMTEFLLKLYGAIEGQGYELADANGNPITPIQLLSNALNSLDKMSPEYSPTITPVVSTDQIKSDLDAFFANPYTLNLQPAIEGALSVQMMGFVDRDYGPALSGIRSDVAGLGGRIDSIATSIGDVATSISQIKIVVNNGSAGMVWDNGRRGAIIQPGRP